MTGVICAALVTLFGMVLTTAGYVRWLQRPKPFDCTRHGIYGQCEFCIRELEQWHHEWRLANDREYHLLYGPKVSLVKQPKRKPGRDFMGYQLVTWQGEV